MVSSRLMLRSLPLLLLPLTFACSAQDAVGVKAPVEETTTPTSHHDDGRIIPLPPAPPLPEGWTILDCDYTNQKTARATPNGALLGVDVVALAVFPRSLDQTVRFIITESVDRVEATIETETGHVQLQAPAELAMSFNRCGRNYHAIPGRRLAIWRYRPETGWVNLGGKVDNLNQLIRVQITEVSRFVIGEG